MRARRVCAQEGGGAIPSTLRAEGACERIGAAVRARRSELSSGCRYSWPRHELSLSHGDDIRERARTYSHWRAGLGRALLAHLPPIVVAHNARRPSPPRAPRSRWGRTGYPGGRDRCRAELAVTVVARATVGLDPAAGSASAGLAGRCGCGAAPGPSCHRARRPSPGRAGSPRPGWSRGRRIRPRGRGAAPRAELTAAAGGTVPALSWTPPSRRDRAARPGTQDRAHPNLVQNRRPRQIIV